MASECKHPIHSEAEQALIAAGREAYGNVVQIAAQGCGARIVRRGGIQRKDRSVAQRRGSQCGGDLSLHFLQPFGIDAICFAQERREGVSEFDGDAASLLLLEAIGVYAGERTHQRGFPMVDVTGGADNH